MAEIKWENEFVALTARYDGKWAHAFQQVEEYLNEAYKNNYELYKTFHHQSKDSKFDLFGLVFRKIRVSDKPFMIPPPIGEPLERISLNRNEQLKDFFKTHKKTSDKKGGESKNIKIYPFCEIHKEAKIDSSVMIGSHTFIGKGVRIDARVKIQGHCYIPSGVTICKDAFIAPGVIFLNDKYPPSEGKFWGEIIIEKGASIGGGVTILPDVIIGKSAVIGAGAVVTKNVPAGELWIGNPAKKMPKRSEYEFKDE